MIRVLAIDDEPLALQQLAGYIAKMPFMQLVAQCQSALEAKRVMEREVVDAIFCDINMPDLNGLDFVRSLAVRPAIVFTTAYSEYAVEGYKVDAIDYLLKPFGLTDFQRAAMKVKRMVEGEAAPTALQSNAIFVKTDYRVVRIDIGDIRYIEGMSEYLRIHLDSQPKPVVTLLSMKKMEDFLPPSFMRIHRSYIVNLDRVREVSKNRVVLTPVPGSPPTAGETVLPIGDNYREAFTQFLATRFLGK